MRSRHDPVFQLRPHRRSSAHFSRSIHRLIPPGYVLEHDPCGWGYACYPRGAQVYAIKRDLLLALTCARMEYTANQLSKPTVH